MKINPKINPRTTMAQGAVLTAVLMTLLLSSTALCSYQTVPLGNYNVSLDFLEKNVTVVGLPNTSGGGAIVWSTMFKGGADNDYAEVLIYDYENSPMFDLEERLWRFMKSYCTMTETDPGTIGGTSGYIATGYARVAHGFGKQVCYAGILGLPMGGQGGKDFIILAHFDNETLNEHVVKTAKVEYVGKVFTI